ncbi:unnamed protein product [Sphagnum balticum]
MRTEFPVVKVAGWRVLGRLEDSIELDVLTESFPLRLMDLGEMPMFKMLYLLKESLIGYERLFARIGAFVERTCRLRSAVVFFEGLANCRNFLGALAFVEGYIKEHKIPLPSAFRSSNTLRPTFDATLTFNRAPRFLAYFRSGLDVPKDPSRGEKV